MNVYELTKDGNIQTLQLTVRGLYKYVMDCIITLPNQVTDKLASDAEEKNADSVFGEPLLSPNSLGATMPSLQTGREKPVRNKRSKSATSNERLGGFLHPRDMRRLTTPFSASNEPEIMVRRHVMLFNFNPVRAMYVQSWTLVCSNGVW